MKSSRDLPPILSIVGAHNSGKTTLLETLIPELKRRGLKIAVIKHTPHGFEMEREGKDSLRLFEAGSDVVVMSSSGKMVLTRRISGEIPLDDIVRDYLSFVDLVITEGFKGERKARIEVLKSAAAEDFLSAGMSNLIAVVGDYDAEVGVPFFPRNAVEDLASFIHEKML